MGRVTGTLSGNNRPPKMSEVVLALLGCGAVLELGVSWVRDGPSSNQTIEG